MLNLNKKKRHFFPFLSLTYLKTSTTRIMQLSTTPNSILGRRVRSPNQEGYWISFSLAFYMLWGVRTRIQTYIRFESPKSTAEPPQVGQKETCIFNLYSTTGHPGFPPGELWKEAGSI